MKTFEKTENHAEDVILIFSDGISGKNGRKSVGKVDKHVQKKEVVHIDESLYSELANEFQELIYNRDYISTTIETQDGLHRFSISAFIYYRMDYSEDGMWLMIDDIVPIWFEFHSISEETGEEIQNDFDIEEFKRYLITF